MKKFQFALAITLLLALGLTACAGGASASNSTISVQMSDFKFDPSTWTVSAGKTVTVDLNNTASVAHTWTVMKTPISGSYSAANQSDIYFNSGQVAPGTTKTVTFTAPSTPGDYQVICTVPGHFEAGMVGHLIVK